MAPTGMMGFFQRAATGGQDRADAFALGDRGSILHHLDQPAIIPHVAESENKKFSFEVGHPTAKDLLCFVLKATFTTLTDLPSLLNWQSLRTTCVTCLQLLVALCLTKVLMKPACISLLLPFVWHVHGNHTHIQLASP